MPLRSEKTGFVKRVDDEKDKEKGGLSHL